MVMVFGYTSPFFPSLNLRSRAILHDDNRYSDPETFNPDRFLTATGQLDMKVPDPIEVFGNSRRICPGRYFAIDILWLATASILATFDINKAVDENGQVKEHVHGGPAA